jgi:hypothetical protein
MWGYPNLIRSVLLTSGLALVGMGSPLPSWAGQAKCFMHGIITPRFGAKEKTTLSDMLRLHFDVTKAEEQAKCEQMMESYCLHQILEKDYNPVLVKGSFKPNSDKSEETAYRFTEKCKLKTD